MSGKENIIANILQNAESEKAETLRAARERVTEIERADEEYCRAAKEETLAKAESEGKRTVERYVSVAHMDVKKLLLQAKRDEIDAVLARAEEKLRSLPQEQYNRLLIGLIGHYAEAGETAVFSAAEQTRAEEAIRFAQSKGYAVRTDGTFEGGLILEGSRCDKDLTLSMLIKEYREERESEIVAMLGE